MKTFNIEKGLVLRPVDIHTGYAQVISDKYATKYSEDCWVLRTDFGNIIEKVTSSEIHEWYTTIDYETLPDFVSTSATEDPLERLERQMKKLTTVRDYLLNSGE